MSYFHVLLRRIGHAFHFKRHWYLTRASNNQHIELEKQHIMLTLHALASDPQKSPTRKLKKILAGLCHRPKKFEKIHVYYSLELPANEFIGAESQFKDNLATRGHPPLPSLSPPQKALTSASHPTDKQLLILYKVSESGRLQLGSANIRNKEVAWCQNTDANAYRHLPFKAGAVDPHLLATKQIPLPRNPLLLFFHHVMSYVHKQNQHAPPAPDNLIDLKKALTPLKHQHSCFKQFRQHLAPPPYLPRDTQIPPPETNAALTSPADPQAQATTGHYWLQRFPDHVRYELTKATHLMAQYLTQQFSGPDFANQLFYLYQQAGQYQPHFKKQQAHASLPAYCQLLSSYFKQLDDATLLLLHKGLGEQTAYELYYAAYNVTQQTQHDLLGLGQQLPYSPSQLAACLQQFCDLMLGFVESLEQILAEREQPNRYDMSEQRLEGEELLQISQLLSPATQQTITTFIHQQLSQTQRAVS